MMSTLSCSTSLRVALTATSGLASDDALMISILRPATMPLRCLTASSAPRMPSGAAGRERPFERGQQADLDGRLLRHALPATARPQRAAPSSVRTKVRLVHSHGCLLRCDSRCGDRIVVKWLARRLQHERARSGPQAEQAVGGKQHDGEEHAADDEVEALAVDQVDREGLQQHEHDRAEEGADRVPHAAEHGDDEDVDQPEVPTDPGVIRPLYQTSSMPPTAAMQPGHRVRRDAVRDDVVAERVHAPRVVADALQRDAERRADQVLDERSSRRARRTSTRK